MREKRRSRRKRKPKLSKVELRKIAYSWDKYGDMIVMMGEIAKTEQEMGNLDELMETLFQTGEQELFSIIENNPELLDKVVALVTKLEAISQMMSEKDLSEMSPDEQIEAGKGIKEFSGLLNDIVECTE